jgi:excisionase family DNA binding protein
MSEIAAAVRVPDPETEPTVTVERAAALLGISRGQGYEGVRVGDIPSIKIGRRIVIPSAALRRLLELDGPAVRGAG